ncbi:hypothetical protein N1028_03345 [Herbiconiux sp. CPCC 203407]|uniref:DUF4190 domain-containing protein n=1 Tax=Herbiconiux oxytropis TaxID=2970915 RepID=A0AA42BU27_9MICO|nr:hypothetical protein [Herbiconiux oxytropis]MCS5720749.1 hypothetical protein [Herbiconiux oxytropis]MCS5724924.1 hypothetical protein [Herbiconiux oxytropis]
MTTVTRKPVYAEPGQTFPGKKLGTVGMILAFFFTPVAVVLCAIALSQSHDAGFKNNRALAGLIVAITLFLVGTALGVVSVIMGAGISPTFN